jgi:hypothetical protein
MRGEKSPLFMKEAREEALHFGWRQNGDDEDIMVRFTECSVGQFNAGF